MPVETLFDFTTGLSRPLAVPAGTLAACRAHVARTGTALRIGVIRAGTPGAHWDRPDWAALDREEACRAVRDHADWILRLHSDLAAWAAAPPDGPAETLTPEDAVTFWHGTRTIQVPPERWSAEHLADRTALVGAVMRGEPREGLIWPGSDGDDWPGSEGCRPLTDGQAEDALRAMSGEGLGTLRIPAGPATRSDYVEAMEDLYEALRGRDDDNPMREALAVRQAGGVVWLLSCLGYDHHDVRLEVPRGCDDLRGMDDNGYEWCGTCGAVLLEDAEGCRRRPCGYREDNARRYVVTVGSGADYALTVRVPTDGLPEADRLGRTDDDSRAVEAALAAALPALVAVASAPEGWTLKPVGVERAWGARAWGARVATAPDGEGAGFLVAVMGSLEASRAVEVEAIDEDEAGDEAVEKVGKGDWSASLGSWTLRRVDAADVAEVAEV